jgi:lysine 2,3-aminomutase
MSERVVKPTRRRFDADYSVRDYDRVAIDVRSHRLLNTLLRENPDLEKILQYSKNETEALEGVRELVLLELEERRSAMAVYRNEVHGSEALGHLAWKDLAAIRILDYIDHAGMEYVDLNLHGEMAVNNPAKMLWLAVNRGTGGARPPFFEDMIHLFRQFREEEKQIVPSPSRVRQWMDRFPSGLDPRIVQLREENRDRILKVILRRISAGEIRDSRYTFEEGLTEEKKFVQARKWWNESRFHLRFAVRSADLLNEMLGNSLDPEMMKIVHAAERAGIPIFVNPYYLSLLHVRVPYFAVGADMAIRDYVLYSRELVEEFGHIAAWEKEDEVRPGKPNVAGWLLPTESNIHRRYPDVAILIPDTVGRACGGLCSSCQRMYGFQKGNLNFDLDRLAPKKSWPEKLEELMRYFEEDSQLRDILVTGGDALMSSDASLEKILDAICDMAERKRKANEGRPQNGKYAEIVRVRLGTRLPVYLPQRITENLREILSRFRRKAEKAGIRQFVIQTHFESPLEVTPEARKGIQRLIAGGWIVTNQHVLTTASSRRGHSARLREVMNDIGVLPYYTFIVKGYMENHHNFALSARAIQEQMEEKFVGALGEEQREAVRALAGKPEDAVEEIARLRREGGLPFLATDRNVINLPGVGKSLTFRVIGITRFGRRILEYEHDPTRAHSPIIEKMRKVVIIESKSVSEYLRQLEEMGEDVREYDGLYGYSMGETEERVPLYEYPPYSYTVTDEMTNLEV